MPRRFDPARARRRQDGDPAAQEATATLRARIDAIGRASALRGEAPPGHWGYALLAAEDREAGVRRPHPRPGLDLTRWRAAAWPPGPSRAGTAEPASPSVTPC